MSNIEEAKVGDKLIYNTLTRANVAVISRLTATQAIVDNSVRFNRKDGRRVGSKGRYSTWARIATTQELDEIAKKDRIRFLNAWLDRAKVTDANLELVEKFYVDMDAMKTKVPA